MQSRWSDQEAAEYVDRYASKWGEALALRVYTSRLIGRDSDLVMHGGGNTSLKGVVKTLLGDEIEALFVKGSGWDLDSIEPQGLPAVNLAHLRRLRGLTQLADEEMVNQFRTHLFDASAPNPSVETLLHAFLPHRFIDHTHADIALVITNQPPGEREAFAREAFGPKWGVVPYVMPGLKLAQLAAEVYERDPSVEGLVLINHGLFTFGDDARTSYERMIAGVDRAERFVEQKLGPGARRAITQSASSAVKALHLGCCEPLTQDELIHASELDGEAARIAPILRAALSEATGSADQPWKRMVLEFRTSDAILATLATQDAAHLAACGPLTPDHVIRTKGPHLFLGGLSYDDDDATLRTKIAEVVKSYQATYDAYFETNAAQSPLKLKKLDTLPRVALVPGIGLFTAGRTKQDARIAADIAEHTIHAKAAANALGRYTALSDADLFDMEYWSLEQAKLGKAKDAVLAGQVALVTGATGAIGFAICRKLIEAGAHVVVTDINEDSVTKAVAELDPKKRGLAAGFVMDVTSEASVREGIAEASRLFGGLDIIVPNAGIAHVSSIESLELAAFEKVVDVNLKGTFLVVREAAALLKRQAMGGHIILNSSKNVFGPGADFGAYSASKAGAHQLAKVAAIELAPAGIRVNMINADAVFGDEKRPSGLWNEVGPARAKSRGLELGDLKNYYRQRNLLKIAVSPDHVANAVVFFASSQTATTGATLPVDGGVAEAFPR